MAETDRNAAKRGARERKKGDVRYRIVDAMVDLLRDGHADITHERIAERSGLSRRTVYRYYTDKKALHSSLMAQISVLIREKVHSVKTERDLLATLHDIHTDFDGIAPLAAIAWSTPQGRMARRDLNGHIITAYKAAAADAVRELPDKEQLLATAMLQTLHMSLWLEMREVWGLSGEQIAEACNWAMRTLLLDLHARKGLPLDQSIGPGTHAYQG